MRMWGNLKSSQTNENIRLKAVLTTSKTHYIQKVIMFRQELRDAFKPRYTSYIDVYVPKIKPDYPKPCVMFYVKNGGGRCFIRAESPTALANELEKLIYILRSDLWADLWLNLQSTSDDMIVSQEFLNDPKFVDLD